VEEGVLRYVRRPARSPPSPHAACRAARSPLACSPLLPLRALPAARLAELQESLAYYKMYDWPEGIGPAHPSTYESEAEDADGLPYGLPFELAPRVTDADHANDVQSMERSLEQVRAEPLRPPGRLPPSYPHHPFSSRPQSLYLVLKVKASGDAPLGWTLPQAAPTEGEMFGKAAERAITETVETPRLVHYPRQPFGFFM
jgi:hypothetical protein